MPCANAMASICPSARSTARYWIAGCSPPFMWSSWEAIRPASISQSTASRQRFCRRLAPAAKAACAATHRGGDRSPSRFRGEPRRRGALAALLVFRPRLAHRLAFGEVLGIEPAEIDWVEHQRWKSSVAHDVGQYAPHEREQDRRAVYEQYGLDHVLRDVAQTE